MCRYGPTAEGCELSGPYSSSTSSSSSLTSCHIKADMKQTGRNGLSSPALSQMSNCHRQPNSACCRFVRSEVWHANAGMSATGGSSAFGVCHLKAEQTRLNAALCLCVCFVLFCVSVCVCVVSYMHALAIVPLALSRCGLNNELGK